MISGQGLKRGAMLGRGAFGFVYRATVNLNGDLNSEVAVKMLEPIDPGSEARISTVQIYKVFHVYFYSSDLIDVVTCHIHRATLHLYSVYLN